MKQGFDEAYANKPRSLLLHADRQTAALPLLQQGCLSKSTHSSGPPCPHSVPPSHLALPWVFVFVFVVWVLSLIQIQCLGSKSYSNSMRIQLSICLSRLSSMTVHCLCSKYGAKRFGGLVRTEINSEAAGPLNELSDDTAITRTQFEDLLAKIDKGLRALPATAQVRHCSQRCFVAS